MNIIIAGNGKVGSALARQLASEGYNITVIDEQQSVLSASVERYDVMAVKGNCASMSVLKDAGVENADLLIALTGADEINLLSCITAHALNPSLHTIARIRDPEYIEQIYEMNSVFGLSMTVNPEKQAATEIERLLKFPGFLRRDTFAKGRAQIVELKIDENSKLRDVSLFDLNSIVRCKVLVCAVLRDGEAIAPKGNFVLREDDRIFVTAPTENLAVLLKNLGIIQRRVKKVMICGGGGVGYYLADLLINDGIGVCIVENDMERCRELCELLPKATVICGDGTDQSLLDSEGLATCDALVTMTGIDELNMIVSLYGAAKGIPHVVTKLSRISNHDIINDLDLGSVIWPKELCTNTILRYVRAMQNQSGAAVSVHSIADGSVEAIEFLVDENTLHCGEQLKDIKLRENVLIVSITKGARSVIPNGNSTFNAGDTLVVVTNGRGVLRQLNDIFD